MWMAPMGVGAIPAKMAGGRGVGGECAIRPDNCARSARAPKSVIDLKVDAELSDFRSRETLKGIPAAVTIPQRRDLSDRADASRLQRLEIIPARRSAAGPADFRGAPRSDQYLAMTATGALPQRPHHGVTEPASSSQLEA